MGAPFRGGRLGAGLSMRRIDYVRTSGVDRRSTAIAFDYRRGVGARTELTARVEFERAQWDRFAIRRVDPVTFIAEGHQSDRRREGRISARHLRGLLFELGLGWESVRSNSFCYSVGRKSVEASVAGWLPGALLFQVKGRAESVSYRDPGLDRVFIFRWAEDVEAGDDSNSLSFRLRRALVRRTSIEGRVAWFRNESLLIGSRYDKTVGSVGLVWTPVGASDF